MEKFTYVFPKCLFVDCAGENVFLAGSVKAQYGPFSYSACLCSLHMSCRWIRNDVAIVLFILEYFSRWFVFEPSPGFLHNMIIRSPNCSRKLSDLAWEKGNYDNVRGEDQPTLNRSLVYPSYCRDDTFDFFFQNFLSSLLSVKLPRTLSGFERGTYIFSPIARGSFPMAEETLNKEDQTQLEFSGFRIIPCCRRVLHGSNPTPKTTNWRWDSEVIELNEDVVYCGKCGKPL